MPNTGPVVFVPNHPNGLLDPLVLQISVGQSVSFLGKSTLFKNPVAKLAMDAFSAIPVYRQKDAAQGSGDASRNEQTFDLCRKLLKNKGVLALFPEGVSHAQSQLQPLKTGAARIVLSAEREARGTLGIQVIPVGLSYEDRAIFRSRVVVEFGSAIHAREYYTENTSDEWSRVEALTNAIREGLDAVVLQAESREIVDGVARVAEWVTDDQTQHNLEKRQEVARELLTVYRTLRANNPVEADKIVHGARTYWSRLKSLGVTDPWAVEVGDVATGTILGKVLVLVALAPVACVGAIINWIPYRLAGRVAARVSKGEEDVLGTVKLLAGSLFLLINWLIHMVLWAVVFSRWWIALLVMLLAPVTGYVALRFDEIWQQTRLAIQHAKVRQKQPSVVENLKRERKLLAEQVAQALRATTS